jgi:L-iditol 2-dehydrogenase
MPCFECDQCKTSRHNTCRNLKFLGCPGQAEGCLAEYIVIPETSCLPIPKDMSYEEAAISEPLAIGVYSINRSGLTKNKKIGILGFGPIGMSVMLPALARGAKKIYVTDKINERLNMAKQAGAYLTGNPDKEDVVEKLLKKIPKGLDIVFECCGKQEALDNALDIIKPGGKIMIIGIPEFDNWSFKADLIRRKEITIINIRRQNHCAETAIELIASRTVDVSKMPTRRFNFEDTEKAFNLVSKYRDGIMKAMIEFN